MTRAQRAKEAKARQLPDTVGISKEDWDAYNWCVSNDFKISVGGMAEAGKWRIAIFSAGTWKDAPYVYDRETLWPAYFEFCRYYYNKYGKKKE